MGLLVFSGSLARVVGPVFVSYIYQEFGTWLLFGIVAASLGLSFLLTLLAYRQLVPYDQIPQDLPWLEQIKFWKEWTIVAKDKDGDACEDFSRRSISQPE